MNLEQNFLLVHQRYPTQEEMDVVNPEELEAQVFEIYFSRNTNQ